MRDAIARIVSFSYYDRSLNNKQGIYLEYPPSHKTVAAVCSDSTHPSYPVILIDRTNDLIALYFDRLSGIMLWMADTKRACFGSLPAFAVISAA